MSPQTLLLIWLAFLGGCIGSFLNVVVYRLPRAQSLAYPGSRCPACGHAIRWRHNIPVLGWLTLRGKCFDCRANIAIRYPLVEALVATMFVVLALRGPLAVADLAPELESYRTNWELACWGLYGYFMLGSTMLLALALMDIDSRREAVKQLPWKPVLALLACGLVIPWLWLPLKLNPRGDILSGRAAINFLSAHAISSNLSFAILLLPATLLWQSVTSLKLSKDHVWFAGASVLLVAAYFGYFGTLEIVALATGLFFYAQLLRRLAPKLAKIPFTPMLFVTAFGWLLTARPGSHYLPESIRLPESKQVADSVTYEILGVSLFVVWAIALLIRRRKMASTKPLT